MVSRRGVLTAAAMSLLAGCTREEADLVSPAGPQVQAAEQARKPGTLREFRLAAVESDVDLGGRIVRTWSYDGRVPGNALRVKAGEQISAVVANRLPEPTTVHWHGIALRNDADGVPGVTQAPIAAGAEHLYRFTAPDPGTYWFHPHFGVQADRGLYAPLIVEDPAEPLSYDDEWVLVLDDWLDGVAGTPEEKLAELRRGGGHMMRANAGGDVDYPHYLLNGRLAADPVVFQAKPGARVRVRIINAGADTVFRVAIGEHPLTVTHTDGFPIVPMTAHALLVGMGERYDVLLTMGDGVFPIVAIAEGKQGNAFGLIRTGAGGAPPSTVRPAELARGVIGYPQMKPDPKVALAAHQAGEVIRLELTGGMMAYDWGINGRAYDRSRVTPMSPGGRVRLDFVNRTMMWHPVHLHGHTFAVGTFDGPRKDTAIVLPGQSLPVFLDTNNPGLWMVHCHNAYHAEAGMMTLLGYRR